jgi:SAM-dependent methyltransferase
MRRFRFSLRYLFGRPPWDTNVTPPELVALIEDEGLPAGQALELGCGTGTNAIYLARHGWQVTALDFVPRAIGQARRKARRAGVRGETRFRVADVSRLDALDLPPFDFALDIGCLHALRPEQRRSYAAGLSAVVRPGAAYLLYALFPREGSIGLMGLTPDGVRALFEPRFRVLDVNQGVDSASEGERHSAWYRLERLAG